MRQLFVAGARVSRLLPVTKINQAPLVAAWAEWIVFVMCEVSDGTVLAGCARYDRLFAFDAARADRAPHQSLIY